ncbi:type II secretion system F family protein, partial [Planctomycetaceae bacterium]|nr:type II secretion system F family protein [Planctomycetaceae bacterium]
DLISGTLSRRFRRRVDRLAFLLSHGMPLSSSLSCVPGIVPNSALLTIRAGDTSGYLQQAVVDAATHHGHQHRLRPMSGFSPTMATMYVMCVPLIGSFIVFGLMKWIIPKFKEIFEGFDRELPLQTVSLIETADFLTSGPWALLLFLTYLGLNILAIIGFMKGFREIDYPLVGRFVRRLDVPELLRILSSTADAKRPFEETVHLMSFAHRRSAIKDAMQKVEQHFKQGDDLWNAMQTTGLITRPESALLKSAQDAGNLPWALNQVADSLERRFAFRWMATLEFLQPAVVLFMGFVTLFICLGMFMPLIKLLNDLS